MELRVLEYFLAIAREQNISAAAEFLHLSQPTLSRQMKELEESLGKVLFIRGNRKITLTEEGMILRKRAQEILDLVKRTEDEISLTDEIVAGDIYIGAGETEASRLIAKALYHLHGDYPKICCHIASGDTTDVIERLDRGLYDFGFILSQVDNSKYEYIEIPYHDTYGILMRKDHPLADKKEITPQDLEQLPLIVNRNIHDGDLFTTWLKKSSDEINIVATYNLLYNASIMVEEGLGCALALDKIINVSKHSKLCFIPLAPPLQIKIYLIWKKYQKLSKAGEKFLEKVYDMFEDQPQS